jgi:hypothetical protein
MRLSTTKPKLKPLKRRVVDQPPVVVAEKWLIEYETESESEDENVEDWDAPIDPGPEFASYGKQCEVADLCYN